MSAFIIVGLVLTCSILVARYGYDSRDTLRSHEQQLAAYGVTWLRDEAHERELADELSAALQRARIATNDRPDATCGADPRHGSVAAPGIAVKVG